MEDNILQFHREVEFVALLIINTSAVPVQNMNLRME